MPPHPARSCAFEERSRRAAYNGRVRPIIPSAPLPATCPANATGPAPAPPPTPVVFPTEVGEPEHQPARLWRLVLIDDDDHSYEYVIEMLGAVFGYGREKAFALARIVDTQGRVTLMTGEKDACEAKQGQVHAYGADPRIPHCKGSMSAIVEAADTPFA